MTIQSQNNNLNYLIDPTFTNVNRLFLFFSRNNAGDKLSCTKCQSKFFFDLPIKNQEGYKKIIDMSNNNDYTTGNLLDFAYLK